MITFLVICNIVMILFFIGITCIIIINKDKIKALFENPNISQKVIDSGVEAIIDSVKSEIKNISISKKVANSIGEDIKDKVLEKIDSIDVDISDTLEKKFLTSSEK